VESSEIEALREHRRRGSNESDVIGRRVRNLLDLAYARLIESSSLLTRRPTGRMGAVERLAAADRG
jgi:hypothetical protein